jgi:hypothetical protein
MGAQVNDGAKIAQAHAVAARRIVVARPEIFCVRKRTTKAGTVSTALVESYRDDQGRPRQRLIANLHGEPDPLRALAKNGTVEPPTSRA